MRRCARLVHVCFRRVEKFADRLTGAVGPFFLAIAAALIASCVWAYGEWRGGLEDSSHPLIALEYSIGCLAASVSAANAAQVTVFFQSDSHHWSHTPIHRRAPARDAALHLRLVLVFLHYHLHNLSLRQCYTCRPRRGCGRLAERREKIISTSATKRRLCPARPRHPSCSLQPT